MTGYALIFQTWAIATIVVLSFCLYWAYTVSPAVELLAEARAYLPGGIFHRAIPLVWERELWDATDKLQAEVAGAHRVVPNVAALRRIPVCTHNLKVVLTKVKMLREPLTNPMGSLLPTSLNREVT